MNRHSPGADACRDTAHPGRHRLQAEAPFPEDQSVDRAEQVTSRMVPRISMPWDPGPGTPATRMWPAPHDWLLSKSTWQRRGAVTVVMGLRKMETWTGSGVCPSLAVMKHTDMTARPKDKVPRQPLANSQPRSEALLPTALGELNSAGTLVS